MAADDGLLRVALAPLGQALAPAHDLLDDDLLDHLLGEHLRALVRRAALQHLGRLVVVLDQRARQRLRELRAVAVERVGLDAERPRKLVGPLAVLDGGVALHVDGLRDRARDEGLRGGHHADVALDREVSRALAPAGVGAVEDGQVRGVEMRRAFERHGPADVVVRGLDLASGEAEVAQHVEGGVGEALLGDPERAGAERLAERPLVEGEADVERGRQRRLDLRDLLRPEAPLGERRVGDDRRALQRAVAHGVGDHLLDDLPSS